jgi:endogenous inhibitor of DNA gyrase (YacG/DUF329 family)
MHLEEKTIECPDCKYTWTYRGKKLKMIAAGKRVYLTCPTCRKNVKIEARGALSLSKV